MVSAEMIQAFLNIVQHGNITAAANSSYTTQSNLSKQIKLLEKELGVMLMIRGKGHHSIELTPYGEEFLRLGRQWESLMREFDNIRYTASATEVSVGALNLMNSFTLTEFYRSVLSAHPDIRLDIHTHHSREIYGMMESHRLDLGFVNTLFPVRNIIVTPIYEEPMFVICSPDNHFNRSIAPEELDPAMELYARWSDEFEIWHDQLWPGRRYQLHVGTSAMAPNYLDMPGRWAIVPASAVDGFCTCFDFSCHSLTVDIPKHTFYQLEQRYPRQSRRHAIEVIKAELTDYLQKVRPS